MVRPTLSLSLVAQPAVAALSNPRYRSAAPPRPALGRPSASEVVVEGSSILFREPDDGPEGKVSVYRPVMEKKFLR